MYDIPGTSSMIGYVCPSFLQHTTVQYSRYSHCLVLWTYATSTVPVIRRLTSDSFCCGSRRFDPVLRNFSILYSRVFVWFRTGGCTLKNMGSEPLSLIDTRPPFDNLQLQNRIIASLQNHISFHFWSGLIQFIVACSSFSHHLLQFTMSTEIVSNETPSSSTKKATSAPPPPDYGPTPWYQSRWFIISGATIFFLAYFVAVVYLSITESTPITATPTKAPTMAPTLNATDSP